MSEEKELCPSKNLRRAFADDVALLSDLSEIDLVAVRMNQVSEE